MDKLRLIGESLLPSEQGNVDKIKEEERLIEKRWEVSSNDQAIHHSLCANSIFVEALQLHQVIG